MAAGSLFRPRLDINYLRWERGQLADENMPPLDPSMLVTMGAQPGAMLYDQVRVEYPALVPLVVVPIPIASS